MRKSERKKSSPASSQISILQNLPEGIRQELLSSYNQIVKNFRERRWEPSELNGGKLCEIAYTILRGHVDGKIPHKSTKPKNMAEACRDFEKVPAVSFPRSVRIQIPRILIALYEIRNNRGVGHVGGDVDPNHMDATCVLEMSKWILSELVRLFHDVSPKEAAQTVDAIVERTLPIIWEVDGKLRVLVPRMTMKDRVLLLLYHKSTPVAEEDLMIWIEHSNASVLRRDILRPAHKEKLIEYDPKTHTVHISPVGSDHVETSILTKMAT